MIFFPTSEFKDAHLLSLIILGRMSTATANRKLEILYNAVVCELTKKEKIRFEQLKIKYSSSHEAGETLEKLCETATLVSDMEQVI